MNPEERILRNINFLTRRYSSNPKLLAKKLADYRKTVFMSDQIIKRKSNGNT